MGERESKPNPDEILKAYLECVRTGKTEGIAGYELMKYVAACLRAKAEAKERLKKAAEGG